MYPGQYTLCLNFRGADVSQVFLAASAQGQAFTSEPQSDKKEQVNAINL
jgi:hypothetical protein